jgi:uncharacterized membrane protein
MTTVMIILRLVHITLGVFWAGTIFFFVTFLEPSVREAGPDGARVMQGLQKRNYLNFMPLIAGLTILSGIALYWRVSAGLAAGWITSRIGLGLTVGAVASVLAFVVGVFGMRRAALGAASKSAALQRSSEGEARDALMAEIQALRQRARTSARWVAVLLAIAVATMAVARYL